MSTQERSTEKILDQELSSSRNGRIIQKSESWEANDRFPTMSLKKRPLVEHDADSHTSKRRWVAEEPRLERMIDPSCCVYLSNIMKNYPPIMVQGFIRNRFMEAYQRFPDMSLCIVRGTVGDALLQFSSFNEANLAKEALDGSIVSGSPSMHARPLVAKSFNPRYTGAFLKSWRSNNLQNGDSSRFKENERSPNAYSGVSEKRTNDYHVIEHLRKVIVDTRKKIEFLGNDNYDLRKELEKEKAHSRRARRDLEDELSDLKKDYACLEERTRSQEDYEKDLKAKVRRLEFELRQNEGDLKALNDELAKQQSKNRQLVEENQRMRDDQEEAKRTASLLGKALEENESLRDQIEQMQMNHALEMGSFQGESFSNLNTEQELASEKARIAEPESQLLQSSRGIKNE
eukprot:scaffold23474_cov125-Cylindrotheca_fusiformis.AAC.1